MREKKSSAANLEKKRSLFVEVGFILALSLILFGFEYKSYDAHNLKLGQGSAIVHIEDYVIIPTSPKVVPPPPPPAKPPVSIIKIVDTPVEGIDVSIDASTSASDVVDIWTPPTPPVKVIVEPEIVLVSQVAPSFTHGGYEGLLAFLRDNIKYPASAREVGISGTVYLSFVIEKDGSVSNITVQRGIGGGCDEEAVRVLKLMPPWSPGKNNGLPVRVKFTLPVKFTLAN